MNLNHLAIFAAVAEARSYTAAARALALDKGQVSRGVAALEAALKVVLLRRSTRSVTLTPAGEELAAQVASPLSALRVATLRLSDRPVTPVGTVTLTTTPDLGRCVVAPLLAAFRARYPTVQVRLKLDPQVVTVESAPFDLALRVGANRPSRLKARRVGHIDAGFFAAPGYLKRHGTPKELTELAHHHGLWPRSHERKTFAHRAPPAAIECDDFGALLEAALEGAGVAVLPTYLATPAVARGDLVRVLPSFSFPQAPVALVTLPERPLPPRVVVLRDFLVDTLPARLR